MDYINMKAQIKVLTFIFLVLTNSLAWAGDAENINACVKKAKELAGVTLDPFSAAYEGNIIALSSVKWANANCSVKFAEVYDLQINNQNIVFKGYSGKESYELNTMLQAKTDTAIEQLNARIALLKKRSEDTSEALKLANPDFKEISESVSRDINKALGTNNQTSKCKCP